MGADRGIHVITEDPLDPGIVSHALAKVVETEKPDVVLMGKQAVDDDQGQVGAMLAERLGWGQASFASKEANLDSDDADAITRMVMAELGALEAQGPDSEACAAQIRVEVVSALLQGSING